jgi:hypothetical protein
VTPRACALVALTVTCLPLEARARPLALWAVNEGEKVGRFDLDHPARYHNSIWDGTVIQLTAGRNETIGFQVQVQAPEADLEVTDITVTFRVPALTRAADIFSEHYLLITKATNDDEHGGWFWYKAAAPQHCTGWMPDALVPLKARPGRGGLPVAVKGGTQQGFWIDLAIPRGPEIPAGMFRGRVTATTNRGTATLPLELTIVDATLPDGDAIKTMIYISDIERRHGHAEPTLRAAYRAMAHRHRLDLAEDVDFKDLDAYKPVLTGAAFTPAAGYTGPGEGLGVKVFGIGFYGAVGEAETKADLWKKFDAYAAWFKANAPQVLAFIYLTDEPRKDRWAWVKERGDWIHANPGPGGELPVFVTMKPRAEVEGAVDIFATVADNVYLDQVPREAARGRHWWFYNGMRPESGVLTTDTWGVDPRVQPWICWLHGVELWFYWESTHWRHNHQGPRAHQDQDVWVDPITFSGGDAEVNGDGTLFYPGEDVFYRDQDRGIPGPISSIRMKNLRRGQQDMAWAQLAVAAGHEAEARAIGAALIPRSFSDAKPDQPASWPSDGSAWDDARLKLIALATRSAVAPH